MSKIRVANLYKVFGSHPEKVIPLLKQGLSKTDILERTGNTVGINDVSFNVDEGEVFVVMGLSGSGKSTVLRCINRLIRPTAGEVAVDGVNMTDASPADLIEIRRHKMSMVFQKFALFPHRTIASNVQYGLEIQGVDKKAREDKAYEVIDLVGLKGYEESFPSELSGGMQQRVGLARALAIDPEILLMDEAFSALDPLIRKEMQDELLDLQARVQKTIVFITHDLDEALKLGDRVAIMKDGAVVQIGTPEDILTEPADDYVREFVQDVDRTKVITAGTIMQKPDAVVLPKDGVSAAIRRMRRNGLSSIFVCDQERKLMGIVRIDDAVKAADQGQHDLVGIIDSSVPTTDKDTPIADLLPAAKNSYYPIAVVGDQGVLLGIIVRVSIIGGIMGSESSD